MSFTGGAHKSITGAFTYFSLPFRIPDGTYMQTSVRACASMYIFLELHSYTIGSVRLTRIILRVEGVGVASVVALARDRGSVTFFSGRERTSQGNSRLVMIHKNITMSCIRT